MGVFAHYSTSDELEDFGMHLIFLKVFLEFVVGPLEDNFFFDKGASFFKTFGGTFVADQLFMLSHHQQERVLEFCHVERDVIEEFHHAINKLKRHKRRCLLIHYELLENKFVTAYHMNRDTRVDQEFL